MAQNQPLLSLAESVLEKTKNIVKQLQVNEFREPTFDSNIRDIPHTPEYGTLHTALKASLEDLSV